MPEILATLACGIFAGAAIYVNFVEQPARLSCGITLAVAEWRPSYKRGSIMQASLAVLGTVLAFLSGWISRDSSAWMIGGMLLFAVIPFTLIVISLTNKKLQNEELDVASVHAQQLLERWGRLHAVRSGLSFLAFLVFLLALRHRS